VSDLDRELLGIFRDEATAALETLSRTLDAIAVAAPEELGGLLRSAFRTMHNVKGAARMAGLPIAELLAHALENGLDACRDAQRAPSESLQSRLRRGMALIVGLAGGADEEPALALIEEITGAADAPTAAPASDEDAPLSTASEPVPASTVPRTMREAQAMVRVQTERLDELMRLAGELLVMQGPRHHRQRELEAIVDEVRAARAEADGALRDTLEEIAGRIDRMQFRERHELRRFGHFAARFSDAVKTLRMQPIAELVPACRKTITDVGAQLGKKARLAVDIGELELDRSILEGLRDPLGHLVRNALDHGLETADERVAAGKPEVGVVSLVARARGTMIELDVADDGRGVDTARIARRAIAAGLVDEARVAEMSEAELVELLFLPGFSTADAVTHVSGRGVGLDVVRDRLVQLGGRVLVLHERGRGTTFRLVVPATLVSARGLVVRTRTAAYVLPVANVDRTLRVDSARVRVVNGASAIERAGSDPLGLAWLSTHMGEERSFDAERLAVVVISDGNVSLGLVVEEVVGEAEYVSRALPWNVAKVACVAGAATLDDASLAVVVDVPDLLRLATRASSGSTRDRPMLAPVRARKRILVVDDSLTSRTLERNILTAAGYDVELAVDGEAGWDALASRQFDLVVSDVEMPRLDGIALAKRIRANARTSKLPIVLVTSRGSESDLAAGSQAGADEYLVKGSFEQRALLEAVSRLL
jgi:chemotaxis protein histidine kinase CheA